MTRSRMFTCLLIAVLAVQTAFHTSGVAQNCSDCKIPKLERAARITSANQAIQSAVQQQDDLRAQHIPYGLPRLLTQHAANERLLYQFEWITSYDDALRIPLWAAYELTKNNALKKRVRQDCFRVDSRLSGNAAALCEDYAEPIYDRGHLVPANDLKGSAAALDNSFLFSNMTPQYSNFNQIGKVWERLEHTVHKWAISADGIYVFTGTVFDRNNDGKRDANGSAQRVSPKNRVAVPSHFF